MADILIVSQNEEFLNSVSGILKGYDIDYASVIYTETEDLPALIKEEGISAVMLDDEVDNYAVLAKKIKSDENNIFISLFYGPAFEKSEDDVSGFIDVFIQKPVKKNILIPTLTSYLKLKKNTDKFKEDNKALNKSLYQLDVLYNTSSKLSGNLDKEKLFEIMFETLEKTLSFELACALIYNSEKPENKFIIHSLKKPEDNVLNILKEKLKTIAKENNSPETDFLKPIVVKEFIKPSYENQKYDIKLLNSDKLTAALKVKDRPFATLLIYRNNPFTKEDVTCFQSIVHQISSSLRTIILYDEIKSANIELKKLERIKSEFVSIVSHELRTPLTPINNSLEIILSEQTGPLSDAAKNFINMAKRNVSRLSGIIEDLLDLSRIQTGKFDFKYKRYNIKTSLDLIQKTFENQAKEKGLNFTLNFEESLPDIYADSHRIEQILSNLVTNAVKFTQKGGKIDINANVIDDFEIDKALLVSPPEELSGRYIKVSIKDTGVGIKEEDIHKIFDKFSQIENSLTRNAGGVGLGLTITKHFVDAHLGGIFVKSKENEGSEFNVVLPVYTEKKAFEINLNASKKTNMVTNLLILKSKNDLTPFVEHLKKENIIKLLKNSDEVSYFENGIYIYEVFFPNLQKGAFDFTVNRVLNAVQNGPNKAKYDIVLEKNTFNKDESYSI